MQKQLKRSTSPWVAKYFVRDSVFNSYSRQVPSKYKKTIVIIAPFIKFGGKVVSTLLERTPPNVRIVVVSTNLKDMETMRSQIPWEIRVRLVNRECNFHSVTAIKMIVLWLLSELDRVDTVVHLIPQSESSEVGNSKKPVICVNNWSVPIFEKNFLHYFGDKIQIIQLEHPLSEHPQIVAEKAFQESYP